MGGRKISGTHIDGQIFDEPTRKRHRKEDQVSPVSDNSNKSLFGTYVSPLIRKISGMVWESIGGSTDASSLDRQKSLDQRPVLGLTEKLNSADISLRDPLQKQVTFNKSPTKLALERQTTEFLVQQRGLEYSELHRAKTCHSIRKSKKTKTPPVRKIFPVSEFTLLRQPSG